MGGGGGHHEQVCAQESVREARGRAGRAVDSADNERQRARREFRLYLIICERVAQLHQAQRAEVAEHQKCAPTIKQFTRTY